MLNLPRWQTIAIIVITALAGVFALPNLLPAVVLDALPGWYAQSRINLGLDLRGGAHFLLEADLRGVMNERLTNLSDSLRGEFRKQQIGYKSIDVDANKGLVVVALREEGQRAKALDAVHNIDPALAVTGAGDAIQLAYQGQDLFRKRKEVIDQSIEILRRRVDETGTIEPTIVRQGDDRILLQVPGIKDTTELKRKINQTAKLTFHLVDENVAATGQNVPAALPPTTMLVPTREGMAALRAANPKAIEEIQKANPRMTPEQICRRFQPPCLPVFKRVIVGGEDLDDAKSTFENRQNGGRPIISFTFNSAGGRAFCAATRANIGKRLAIQLDNEIISAPVVQSAICGGSGIITGQFTTQQTQEQALLLRSGALPATLTIIEERTVGADLGADAIHAGTVAAVVGTALVVLFMLATYGPVFGGFASLAMVVNLLLVLAGMSVLGASLTLPGIAGLVLTVGISVDSNVLIYERVREEKMAGRSPFSALATGYERALTAVIDSNLTALIAGVLLFGFGSGPIRGFATSLSLGLLTHLFTATVFTRMLLAAWVRWRRPTALPI
jgi:preprotein translocase subunit SecD